MDNIPAPPKDTGLRNIIDKLAEFVARNGPEFETITKAKQQSNPRFSFLFGGEYYQYYQWRVSAEQAILKQQNQQQGLISQTPPSMMQIQPNWNTIQATGSVTGSLPTVSGAGVNNNIASQIEAINAQQITLQEQIRQSEQNLSAQHNVLMQQQQNQIDEAIEKAQNETVLKQAEENNIRLSEFDTILQPIIDSCTKDSISAGKNWILQYAGDAAKCNVLMQYLLKKALINDVTFQQKLHLIYLVNDVLHHCVRKHADDLKSNLENIVIPMFCSAEIIASEEQKAKLLKLLSLWESKSNLFDACVISKLQSPNSSMAEYKTNLVNLHLPIVSAMQQQTQKTFEGYKQQHQIFIQHASQQIAILDQQKLALKNQQSQPLSQPLPQPLSQPLSQPSQPPAQASSSDQVSHPHLNPNECDANQNNGINGNGNNFNRNTGPPPLMSQNISMPRTGMNPNYISSQQQRINFPSENNFQNPDPPPASIQNSVQSMNHGAQTGHYQLPPPNFMIPDMSKPPPGFNAPPPMANIPVGNTMDDCQTRNATVVAVVAATAQPIPEDTKPTVPYYELPAGLMVPLIRLEDCSYKPLDPEDIRLPAPIPPSERLLQAIEAFYSLPSHDRPRDGEGWEKLGLYEYYKVKNAAKKIKEEEVDQGIREKSRSPTPILLEPVKPKRINKRRYRSKTRSKSRSRSRSRERDRSRERERDRERERERRNSRSRSISPRPSRRGNNNRRHQRQSPKRSPALRRSQTPPTSFVNFSQKTQNDCIEESNKGHQLLMKMGWSGSGLGAQGQGIETPISGGDVRDRQDQYKGVGVNLNDPYENFRKNKGAAFIHRMRSRDHDRKKSKTQSNADEETTDY